MWKQYGSTGGSVVIQSTYQKLSDALPSEIRGGEGDPENTRIFMGMVQYKSYFSPLEGLRLDGNMLSPFIHKRTALEYEKGVRAFLMFRAVGTRSIPSVYVDVDIEELIETIRVRPGTSDWESQTIERLIGKYGLGMKIMRSEIDAEPMF